MDPRTSQKHVECGRDVDYDEWNHKLTWPNFKCKVYFTHCYTLGSIKCSYHPPIFPYGGAINTQAMDSD